MSEDVEGVTDLPVTPGVVIRLSHLQRTPCSNSGPYFAKMAFLVGLFHKLCSFSVRAPSVFRTSKSGHFGSIESRENSALFASASRRSAAFVEFVSCVLRRNQEFWVFSWVDGRGRMVDDRVAGDAFFVSSTACWMVTNGREFKFLSSQKKARFVSKYSEKFSIFGTPVAAKT